MVSARGSVARFSLFALRQGKVVGRDSISRFCLGPRRGKYSQHPAALLAEGWRFIKLLSEGHEVSVKAIVKGAEVLLEHGN